MKDTPMAGSEDQQDPKEDGILTKIKKAIFG